MPSGISIQARGERLLGVGGASWREADVDAPVLHRVERPDLALALDDQAHGHRLHAARRQARTHPLPQDRRDAEPHQAVQDAASLLRVEELQVDRAGFLERLEDRVAGDLGERHPLGVGGVDPQQGGDVVGDGLALAVVVRRQDDVARALHDLLQVGQVLLGVLGDHVIGHEIVLDVDARGPRSPCPGPGCGHRKPGRRSRRPGTSRSSSPWPAIRRPPGSWCWPWPGTFLMTRGSVDRRAGSAGTVPPVTGEAVQVAGGGIPSGAPRTRWYLLPIPRP